MHEIVLLLPALISLFFFNKKNIEFFNNETCDITDRKIKLLEEKITLESQQTKSFPTDEITKKIDEIYKKIKELNQKIIENKENIDGQKQQQQNDFDTFKKEEEEKEKKKEEEIYSKMIDWNSLIYDNYIINAFLIFFMLFLILVIFYIFISTFFSYIKKRKLKLDKVNIKYDSILDEIKKSKVKNSLKVKKGSFFDFKK